MTRLLRQSTLLVGLVAAVLAAPANATAHPLGNFTVNVYAGIQLTSGEVRVDYVLDIAEIPTVQVRPEIDTDADGDVSDAERSAWAERTASELVSRLTLTIDREAVQLDVVSASMQFRPGQGGLDVLRLEAVFTAVAPSNGRLASFTDANFEDRIGWREITAVGANGAAIANSTVPATSVTNELRSYPDDLLSSPLDVREASIRYRPGASAKTSNGSPDRPSSAGSRSDVAGGAFAGLVERTGPFTVVALLLAFGFGMLHALGPGHGKTLMAAYLVGAGGRARHAVAVGGSMAVMHTASVLALGFLVMALAEVFAPERVYPWLGLVSGLIAMGLGAALLVSRLGAWSNREPGHGHERPHPHEQPHLHDATVRPLSRGGLAALAVAGGVLPSPTALVVLLASVALHRVAYGLALIGAFSLGLATALGVVGIVALRARDAVASRMAGRLARLLPVASASAIAVVGVGLTVRGFAQL